VRLALTDPDTNAVMPLVGERFAGDLATVSQADGEVVFAQSLAHSVSLRVLPLRDNVSGKVPPLDGFAVGTWVRGTLYVVDASANSFVALTTDGLALGTILVGEPKDNSNPLVGTLDPSTGKVAPFGNHFVSPKGLLFVGDCGGSASEGGGDGQGDHGEGDGGRGDHGHAGQGNGHGDPGAGEGANGDSGMARPE
jgi:hypothetical protein